jgi:hypothetical protein
MVNIPRTVWMSFIIDGLKYQWQAAPPLKYANAGKQNSEVKEVQCMQMHSCMYGMKKK